MKLKDLKLKNKLGLSFGLALLIIVSIGWREMSVLNSIESKEADVIKAFDISEGIMNAQIEVGTEMQVVSEMISALSIQEVELKWTEIQDAEKRLIANANSVLETAGDESWGEEFELYKQGIAFEMSDVITTQESIVKLEIEKVKELKIKELQNESNDSLVVTDNELKELISPQIQSIKDALLRVGTDVAMLVEEAVSSSSYEANKAKSEAFILLLFGLVLCICSAIVITRSITIPVKKGLALAKSIAKGDLTANVSIDQKDEIGQLATELKRMTAQLRLTISSIKAGADNIAGASQQLSSGAQQISNGASEQAASTEEISSAMEEMASNIQQNTANAENTRELSLKSSKKMDDVALASEESLSAVQDIFSKINIVVDIAEKTDLLAINAAIEAARAGDEGRGFAVVASEVRKLAERSQKAASEIVELAETGHRKTLEATDMLREIVPEIQETSRLIDEIANASMEQDSGAEMINAAIQQLGLLTQQNASSSEEMASNSVEMASQASELEQLTQFFHIDEFDGISINLDSEKQDNVSFKEESENIEAFDESDMIKTFDKEVNDYVDM